MEVTNRKSAILRVAGRMKPRPVVLIELRRPPQFNDAVLSRFLKQVPNVRAVGKRQEGGYWVYPVPSIDSDELNRLVSDLVKLANIII